METIVGTIITSLITFIGGIMYARLKFEHKRYACIQEGMQALLRDRLIYVFSVQQKAGYADAETREDISHMYHAYVSLGGNGVIPDIYKRFQALPLTPPEKTSSK